MKKYILHPSHGEIETHIDFKGNLNEKQYEVVTRAEGPCLVLAGAGSGKTRTLIYRLAYLLERGVPPGKILLMTFTNKAANEMRSRTEMLLGYQPKGLWSGTFHHVGNRSLRMYARELGVSPDFGILDQKDSSDVIKACIKKARGKTKDPEFPKASVLQSIISLSANTGSSIADIVDKRYPYFLRVLEEIKSVNSMYAAKKKESGNMDYDDLLSKWKWLLENVPSARDRFSSQFEYIMVDEYQDTNFLQADIVDILGSRHGNVLVVGDDAQSIYSFRGARVENILSFPEKFKDTKVFKLETNYRSTPDILDLANDSLSRNRAQFKKELKAVNPRIDAPALVEVKDLYSQASFVAQRALEMMSEDSAGAGDIAVLFRAHYQSAELEMELTKRGIPYVVRGGIRFFEQAHVKDVLSYLRVVSNPTDETAWLRVLALCPGIGPGYAEKIYSAFRSSGRPLMPYIRSQDLSGTIPLKAREGYKFFSKIMRKLTDPAMGDVPGNMIEAVLEQGYETYLLATFDNAKDRIDDIHEVVNFSHSYSALRDFLNDITLRESFKGEVSDNPEGGSLILSTIHQAKGLEWDTVMVIGLSEGQFPHPKAMGEDAEMEEERRLFYVAVTRARKYLYLIHPAMRYDHREGLIFSKRSRFLEELDPAFYELWEVSSSSGGRGNGFSAYNEEDLAAERYSRTGDFEDNFVELD
jgi:DNA helicase II / ATP-dependent DNA helicase PcrA